MYIHVTQTQMGSGAAGGKYYAEVLDFLLFLTSISSSSRKEDYDTQDSFRGKSRNEFSFN